MSSEISKSHKLRCKIVGVRNVLVTGGAGYIGTHTVVALLENGFNPIVVDNFSNSVQGIIPRLEERCGRSITLFESDCCDSASLTEIARKYECTAVIHFAAFKAVGESVEQPLKYYHNNLASMSAVIQCMYDCGIKDLVFSSSCTVYGQPDHMPVHEHTPMLPAASPYGYTKQICEKMLVDVQNSHKPLNVAVLRYFNPVGADSSGLIGELPLGVPNNLMPYVAQAAAGIREILTVFGNDYNTPDGTCIRDFIHVSDLAEAHVAALNWLRQQHNALEIFNLGQGIGNSVLEVIETFKKVNRVNVPYQIGERRNGDIEKIWASADKALKILGWRTQRNLETSVEDTWRWQQNLPL